MLPFRNVCILVNPDLSALTLVLLLFNIPYLASASIPTHDTMQAFQIFYYHYSELYYGYVVPHWMPYGMYGVPAYIPQMVSLSGVSYLCELIGWLLNVKNVLLLFKISLLIEQVIFLTGFYLFSRLIFSRRSTVLMVCTGAVLSTIWFAQVYFNFRLYYMFPVVAYCIVSFFSTHRPEFVWLAGISGVVWTFGNLLYFAPLWLFTCFCICLVFLIRDRTAWRHLFSPARSNLLAFAVCLIVFGAYWYLLMHALDDTTMQSPGRDPATGRVNLDTFLSYTSVGSRYIPLQSLLLGWPVHLPWGSGSDNSIYIGFLPIAFFIWGLVRVRGTTFLALLSALIALIWLARGGLFAQVVYYFPMMSYYRHISLIYGLIKVLVLLCAGFGWENFWATTARVRWLQLMLTGLLMGALTFAHTMLIANFFVMLPLLTFRIGAYVGAMTLFRKGLIHALLFAFLVDLLSFQLLAYWQSPHLPTSLTPALDGIMVSRLPFQWKRSSGPTSLRQERALSLITAPGAMGLYAYAYGFLQFDPCWPAFRVDLLSSGVDRLFQVRDHRDPAVRRVLGCDSPKLRLMSNAIWASNSQQAEQLVHDLPNLDEVLILEGTGEMSQAFRVASDGPTPTGSLEVLEFTANELVIDADVTTDVGAWLVYADAFHPGWHATINGAPVPIAKAYLAFKAVHLEKGRNIVRFVFRGGTVATLASFAAVFGTLASILLLGVFVRMLFSRPHYTDDISSWTIQTE